MSHVDDLGPIIADLEDTGVHVAASAEDWIDPDQLATLEQHVAASPDPVFVVLAEAPADAGTSWGDDLAFRLRDATGEAGLYLGINNRIETDPVTWSYLPQRWGGVAGESDLARDAELFLEYGDGGEEFEPAEGMVALTGHLADDTVSEIADQGSAGLTTAADRSAADTDGPPVLLVVAGVAVVVAAVVVWLLQRRSSGRRAPGRTAASTSPDRGFVLPASVLDRVREAGDAEAVRRADAAVLALGQRIDDTELETGDTGSGSGSVEAWQEALDHYDAATRLLPSEGRDDLDVLDAVGALVLAQRGSEALDAATTGSRAEPVRPCFLNPLHPPATDPRPLEVDGRRLEAPLCDGCRADLEAGRRPDVLDVVHHGQPVHYFETDREPWASTGFGSLDPDLLTRLQGRAR